MCNCPFCRHGRGEIGHEAIAWYLKGMIEQAKYFIDKIKFGASLDELNQFASLQEYNRDESEVLLFDLMKNGKVAVDPALLHPYKYALDEADYKDRHLGETLDGLSHYQRNDE